MDQGQFAYGVFIDVQKTFDMVNHKILLDKLSHYGIRGTALKWLTSYLSKRKQFVTISGTTSGEANMLYGVPQGSIPHPYSLLYT